LPAHLEPGGGGGRESKSSRAPIVAPQPTLRRLHQLIRGGGPMTADPAAPDGSLAANPVFGQNIF
jgi:hypothetical protein